MGRNRDRSYHWVFYTTSGLLFAGAMLRAPLFIGDHRVLLLALLLLLAWLALFVSEPAVTQRWRPWFHVYLLVQTAITVFLLAQPDTNDFFAVLLAILSMQIFERYPRRVGAACLGVFVPSILLPLLFRYDGAEAVTLTVVYTALNIILGAYTLATRGAERAHADNQRLGRELTAANIELRDYSARLERLAVAQERSRVARDLHDSVTQTIFSMTLASQSAAILLQREPGKVGAQLERLTELTRSALAEMHMLVAELAPEAFIEEGLAAALRRDAGRRAGDGLTVSVLLDPLAPGETGARLSAAEEKALLRISQEALNNVAKHSGAGEATVRLGLGRRPFVEIVDGGRGFDTTEPRPERGLGLTSMRERAVEIDWDLEVESSTSGTRIVARRTRTEEGER